MTTRRILAVLGLTALAALSTPVTSVEAATPLCFGKTPTIVGTEGPDDLVGGPTDVVYAGGGDDFVYNARFICGGPGNDRLQGSSGTNSINGGDGNDRITGDYDGGTAGDVLQGNAGDDYIVDLNDYDYSTDVGTDVMRGGIGHDTLVSTVGADKLYGEAGRDALQDEAMKRTILSGGPDADTLCSSSIVGPDPGPLAADALDGGTGSDTSWSRNGDGDTRVNIESPINTSLNATCYAVS